MATTPAADAAATQHAAVDPQDTTHTAPPIVAASDAASWRSNIRRKRCVDAPTPSPQKMQCECDNADSETPLIPPPLQKEPSTPVVDQCDNGVGLRLIDVCSLQKGLEHLCCRKCSEANLETMIDEEMRSFLVFHNERLDFSKKHKKTRPMVDDTYKMFKLVNEKEKNSSSSSCCVAMKSETCGFATTLNFECECEKTNA
jgi:hypothetical protein